MTYWTATHKNLRTIVEATFAEMRPRTKNVADYISALNHFDRENASQGRSITYKPRIFATCLECCGEGDVSNPAWSDDDNGEPEDMDCEVCGGVGYVEIVDPVAPISDETPF